MKYKLMAVDIDGTLLNSKSELTQKTINTVKKAVKKGLIFTIATGRPIQGVKELNIKLGLDLPFITYNGAMVVTGKNHDIIFNQSMNPKDAKEILKKGNELDLTVILWSNNKLYVNKLDEKAEEYSTISGVKPALITDEVFNLGITKLIWYDEAEKILKLEKDIYKIMNIDISDATFNAHTSRPYFLEFVDKKASKALAMEKLGEYFGIKQEEMIAIGDGFNDLSMIKYAGLGIAMENAPDEIKKLADFTTLSNDNDGLSYAIEKFIL